MRRTWHLYLTVKTLLLCLLVITMLLGYGVNALAENAGSLQARNLQKLCKVWGYVKYTHPAFLSGKKDWDAELIELIQPVSAAGREAEVNDILYSWFSQLGEVDYGTDFLSQSWVRAAEEDKYVQADTSWTADASYIGESLAAMLSQMKEIPVIYRGKGPVQFSDNGDRFPNEKRYEDMDYGDVRYRLLGLFRLWNTMEYYHPYLDILDDDWDALLLEYIPVMLEGTDKQSYELTLAAIAAKLHDAHGFFADQSFLDKEFGTYIVPVRPVRAQGQWVVETVFDSYKDVCPLIPGDVLLSLNGADMREVAACRKQYLSVPEDEKLAVWMERYLLRSQVEAIEMTVLRDNAQVTVTCQGIEGSLYEWPQVSKSHELLAHNIGLINPAALVPGEIRTIMMEFADTDGLIVDLRQYPSDNIVYSLAGYLHSQMPFVFFTYPSQTVPGVFIKIDAFHSGSSNADHYKNPVVLLMNKDTMSHAEFTVMSLRNGPNAVVMGEDSIGADGNVAMLPLPGGNAVWFTGFGVYTPEGGQTQRIGLSPDIYVEPTIAGIREGRDELMEAAVQYILDHE